MSLQQALHSHTAAVEGKMNGFETQTGVVTNTTFASGELGNFDQIHSFEAQISHIK